MDDWTPFRPPKLAGAALQGSVLLALMAAIGVMVTAATEGTAGPQTVLLLVAAVLLSLLVPLFAYRLYALIQADYSVGREGLRLRWGLRQVRLPHELIVDNALGEELERLPELPRWRWPGSVLGRIQDEELGEVEYLAAQRKGLVLIGTLDRVYALSPEEPQRFLAALRNASERGSLEKGEAVSLEPSFVLTQAWEERQARVLLLGGAALALGLLVLVGFFVQGQTSISLGFDAFGQPDAPVAAAQLFLLPAINLVIYMGNLLLGLILYRETAGGLLAKVIWGSSLLTSLLFLGAVLFIL